MAGKLLTFSPPSKVPSKVVEGRAVDAEVPILLLQPFSKSPQVTFEQIPVGQEAVRQLKVSNPSNTDHMVTLSDTLRSKGFRADPEVFKLLPGQSQLVSFFWKPNGNETSSRLAVPISTDKGYKGRFVLLGTVREEPKPLKPPRKNLVKSSILTSSQKPNLSSRATTSVQTPKKVNSTPARACKKAVPPIRATIPKEFKSSANKNAGRENLTSKVSASAQVSKKAATAMLEPCKKTVPPVRVTVPKCFASRPNKNATSNRPASSSLPASITCDPLIGGDAQSLLGGGTISVVPASNKSGGLYPLKTATCTEEIRREMFACGAPALEATANVTVEDSEDSFKTANATFENSLEMSKNAFNDSLEPGKLADSTAVDAAATVNNSEEHSDFGNGNNDTFVLDLSAEMLYQQIIEKQSCASSQKEEPITTSAEQAKPLLCTPQEADIEGSLWPPQLQAISNEQRSSSPKCPAKASKEDSLPDIENLLTELELVAGRDPRCSVDDSLLEML
ncbi:uncharacterized protein LOC144111243 [Amblyomma americanum]